MVLIVTRQLTVYVVRADGPAELPATLAAAWTQHLDGTESMGNGALLVACIPIHSTGAWKMKAALHDSTGGRAHHLE